MDHQSRVYTTSSVLLPGGGGRGVLVSESVSGGVVHTKYCTPSSKYTVTYYYELLTIVYAYENIKQ